MSQILSLAIEIQLCQNALGLFVFDCQIEYAIKIVGSFSCSETKNLIYVKIIALELFVGSILWERNTHCLFYNRYTHKINQLKVDLLNESFTTALNYSNGMWYLTNIGILRKLVWLTYFISEILMLNIEYIVSYTEFWNTPCYKCFCN